MDLRFTPSEDAFRTECRQWLEANNPNKGSANGIRGLPSGDTREGLAPHLQWERALFDARWAVVSWPEAYGGRDATAMEWLIFEEEYYRAGCPQRVTQNGIFLLAPTVFEFGTPEQRDRILPRMAAAEDLWCQGWSEPNAGSDLAGIQSRGVRDDAAGGWRLSGQKTWTTRGAFCTHMFGLFRTDPAAGRHNGLTYFLVPLDAPGITVRGFGRLDGDEGFAEVFLDDVFVADSRRARRCERGMVGRDGDDELRARPHVAQPGSVHGERGAPRLTLARAQRVIRSAAARCGRARYIDAEAYRWQTFLTVTRLTDGENLGAESSMTKVFWSDLDVRLHETAMELLGPDAEVDDSVWTRGYQFALSGPIYAGTNEIQRNVIAERVLGLPRR